MIHITVFCSTSLILFSCPSTHNYLFEASYCDWCSFILKNTLETVFFCSHRDQRAKWLTLGFALFYLCFPGLVIDFLAFRDDTTGHSNSLLTWITWLLFHSQHYQMILLNCNRDCLLPLAFQVKWLLSTSWTMSRFHDVVQQGPLVTWLPHPHLLPSPPVSSALLYPFCNSSNAWNAFLPCST